jgi:hypothetical protein
LNENPYTHVRPIQKRKKKEAFWDNKYEDETESELNNKYLPPKL